MNAEQTSRPDPIVLCALIGAVCIGFTLILVGFADRVWQAVLFVGLLQSCTVGMGVLVGWLWRDRVGP